MDIPLFCSTRELVDGLEGLLSLRASTSKHSRVTFDKERLLDIPVSCSTKRLMDILGCYSTRE